MAEINKAAILATSKLPAFVKEDHTKFVEFLDAYYEWLNDGYALTDHQSNIDIDKTVEGFFSHFENMYLAGLPSSLVYNPDGTRTSRELAIKNIKEFYGSKGTEKSFKFLFRILFDLDVEITYPKDNILRSSDGRWLQRKYIRVLASEVPTGWTSGTITQPNWYCVVRETVTKIIGGISYTEIFLDDETGVFAEGSPVFIGAVQLNPVRLLTGVKVLSGGFGHSEGELLGAGTTVVSVASVGLNGEIESIKVLEPGDSSGSVAVGISAAESLEYNKLFYQQELALTPYTNFLERLYGITSVTAQSTTPQSAPALVVGTRTLTEKFDPQDWTYWSTTASTTSPQLSSLLYQRITTDSTISQSQKERLLAYLGTSPSLFASSPLLGQSWIYSTNKNAFSAYNLNGTNLGVGANSYAGGNQEAKDTTKFLLQMSNILFPLVFDATFKAKFLLGDQTYYTVFEAKILALSSLTLSVNETNRYNTLIDNDQLYTLSATEKQNLYVRILAMIGTLHPVWGVFRSPDVTTYDTSGFPSGLTPTDTAGKGFKATNSPISSYDILKRLCGFVNFDGTTFASFYPAAPADTEIDAFAGSISISDACKLRKPYSYGTFTTLWSNADETPYDIQYEYFFALQPSEVEITTVNGIVPSGLSGADYTNLENHINTSVITGIEYSYKIKRLYAQVMYGFDEIGMPKEKALDPSIKPYLAAQYSDERLYKQNTKIYRGTLPTDLSNVATQSYAMPGKSIERKWTKLPHLVPATTKIGKNLIMWKIPLYPETYANFLTGSDTGALIDIRTNAVLGTFDCKVCEVHQRIKSSGTKVTGTDESFDSEPAYLATWNPSGIPGREYDPIVVNHVLLNYETAPIPLQPGETGNCSASVDMLFAIRAAGANTFPIQPLYGDGNRYTSTVDGIPRNTSYLIPNDTERLIGTFGTTNLSPGTSYNNTTVETYLCVIGEIDDSINPQTFAYNENYALQKLDGINLTGQIVPLSALEVRIPGYPEQVDPYCDVVNLTSIFRTNPGPAPVEDDDFLIGDTLIEVTNSTGVEFTYPAFFQTAKVTGWTDATTRILTLSEMGLFVTGLASKFYKNPRTGYVYTALSSVSSTSTYPKLTGTLNVVTETDVENRTRSIITNVPYNASTILIGSFFDITQRGTTRNRLISATATCVSQSAFSDCYVSSHKLLLANILGNKQEFVRASANALAEDKNYRYDSEIPATIATQTSSYNPNILNVSSRAGFRGTGYNVGDWLSIVASPGFGMVVEITNVSGGGIDLVKIINPGTGYAAVTTGTGASTTNIINSSGITGTGSGVQIYITINLEPTLPIERINVSDGGTNYSVGDIVTINGGTTLAQVQVSTVLSGVVTSVALLSQGYGYANSVSGTPTATTFVSGTGVAIRSGLTLYVSTVPTASSTIITESRTYIRRALETTLPKGYTLRYTKPTMWSAPATYTLGVVFPQQLVTCDATLACTNLYKMTGYTNTYAFYGTTRPVVFLQDQGLTSSTALVAGTLSPVEPTDLSGVSLSASSLYKVTMVSGVFNNVPSSWTWSATVAGGAGPSWMASNGSGFNTTSGTAADQNIFVQGFGLNSKYGTLNGIDERVSTMSGSGLRGTQPPRELSSNVVYTPEDDLFYFEPNEKTQIEWYLRNAYTIEDPTTWLESNKAKVLPVYGYKASEVGTFLTSDGFVSADKVTQDNRYYQNYSYVISSAINIDEYKEVVKNVTHPAGYAMFGRVVFETTQEPKMGVTTNDPNTDKATL